MDLVLCLSSTGAGSVVLLRPVLEPSGPCSRDVCLASSFRPGDSHGGGNSTSPNIWIIERSKNAGGSSIVADLPGVLKLTKVVGIQFGDFFPLKLHHH